MLSKEKVRVSDVKMGSYKKTLTDIHRWQDSIKNRKPPHIQFLSWLFGN